MEITLNNHEYILLIITKHNYTRHEDLLATTKLCDRMYITDSYETLSYSTLEEDGYAGFFLFSAQSNTNVSDSTIIHATMIVDLLFAPNTMKLELLCANAFIPHTPGLMAAFTSYIFNELHKQSPSANQILLRVAQINKNARAVAFYKKLGFRHTHNENEMVRLFTNVHTQMGRSAIGGRRKTKRGVSRRKYKRRRCIQARSHTKRGRKLHTK